MKMRKDTTNDAKGKFQNENYFKFDGWKTIIGERRGELFILSNKHIISRNWSDKVRQWYSVWNEQKLYKREIERERERERINCSQVDISNRTTTTMIHTFRTYSVFPHTIYFV